MKKVILMLAVVLIGTGCWAQKSNVSKAKNKIYAETPDFDGAREAIKLALEDESTKDQTNTWYVAGLIGNKEVEYQLGQQMFGNSDPLKSGAAALESCKYWLKADELALVPNEKGKIDSKTHKTIQQKILSYYTQQDLVRYGILMNEQKDYQTAYEALKMHVDIPNLPMMDDEKLQQKMPRDTTYNQCRFFAAVCALQAGLHQDAIAILEDMRNVPEEAVRVNMTLADEYLAVKDSAKYLAVLKESSQQMPNEAYFLQTLINYYINTNQTETAIASLDEAIRRQPNEAQYYRIKGALNEKLGKFDEGIENFNQAIAKDANDAESYAGLGYIKVAKASKILDDAAYLDDKEYAAQKKVADEIFQEAIPAFKKAHELKPEERQFMLMLKQLYYRMKMEKEYEEIEAELNK